MKHIFIVTHPDGTKTAHSAIKSLLEHPKGVPISSDHFYRLKNKNGFPFSYKGILIESVPIFTTKESRELDIQERFL